MQCSMFQLGCGWKVVGRGGGGGVSMCRVIRISQGISQEACGVI